MTMKQQYEDRLQRAKKKLHEEKERRKDEGRDDASYVSEVSRTSRASFCSEYSRASARRGDQDTKGPRCEWRNKAKAVIERGKVRKEEAEMLKDDASVHSRNTTNSFKVREAQIESLVKRNAHLNEREKMLKIERSLIDRAEAETKADIDSYYDLQNPQSESGSFESQQTSSTTQTTNSRAKRVRDDIKEEELGRNFQEAKNAWKVREKTNPTGPTPLKSNLSSKSMATKLSRSASFHQPSSRVLEDSHESEQLSSKRAPESPESVKSFRSIKSSRSMRSTRSNKSTWSARTDQAAFDVSNNKSTKTSKYGSPKSPNESEKIPSIDPAAEDSLLLTPTLQLETKLSYRQSNRSNFSEYTRDTAVTSIGASESFSTTHSQRSRRSYRGGSYEVKAVLDERENTLPVEELSFPVLADDSMDDGENQAPPLLVSSNGQSRELSYREKSAILASVENSRNERSREEAEDPMQRDMFRERGQVVKKKNNYNFTMRSSAETGSNSSVASIKATKSTSVHVLGEKQYNGTNNSATTNAIINSVMAENNRLVDATPTKQFGSMKLSSKGKNTTTPTRPSEDSLKLSNLVNENKELKARLERERTRRSQLDDKTVQLQLEIHQRGEELSELKKKKDFSESHKEEIYKLEDSLREANKHLVTVMDENAKLREELETERAKRGRMESQARHYQMKLKQKSEEVVALARELQRKEDRFNEELNEERHNREVTEAHLAKACLHIKHSEEERDDDLDELEKENAELRHTVERLEDFLKLKIGALEDATNNSRSNNNEQQQPIVAAAPFGSHNGNSKIRKSNHHHHNPKSARRRSSGGGSLQNQDDSGLASKPSFTTAISEITTDFDFEELDRGQMAEI